MEEDDINTGERCCFDKVVTELVKVAKKITEDGRVAVRHVRRDALDGLKEAGKEAGVSEDEVKSAEKQVQKITDDFVKKLDDHLVDKEKEILTV